MSAASAGILPLLPQDSGEVLSGGMRYRLLGRTGVRVSLVGLGGHHLGRIEKEEDSLKLVRAAVEAGITFLDNAWDYHNGLSELRMGKALDGIRDKVFLMTKIDGRTREAAARQIDMSLGRLRTDRLDLLQVHEMIRLEDPDRIFAEGGAMEALLEAKKAGKTRFIGFTGHKDPLVHLRALETAAKHGVRFDAVQMPLNVMDAHFRSFEKEVLPVLVGQGIGALAMKSMGDGAILGSRTVSATECLHYSMSLPVSTVITGIENEDILKQALSAVASFKPLTEAERATLLQKTAEASASGRYEPFKTGSKFDSTARHPEWLE